MAEQGGPNDTNKKGHHETNPVEGRGEALVSSSSTGSTGGGEGESLAEAAVASAQTDTGRHEKGFRGGRAPGAEDGPSMVPNTGRGTGPTVTDSMHTDLSLIREASGRAAAQPGDRRDPERSSFAPGGDTSSQPGVKEDDLRKGGAANQRPSASRGATPGGPASTQD